MVLAWEYLLASWCWSSFCCCCYSLFVDVFHSHFLFDIIPHPSVDYRQIFRSVLYFQPSPLQSDSLHFHFSTILLPSYRERYGFEWTFFTHGCFLPYAPSRQFWHIPDILAQPAFIKVSLGAPSYILESCRTSYWSSKHRPGPSVCLINSNSQSFIQLKFVFIHVNIVKVLLGVKTLVRSAATLFRNNENIKQQPN